MLLSADVMSGRRDDVKGAAMKTVGFCVLSALLSMAVHGGISDALSASGPPLSATPVSPSSAAAPAVAGHAWNCPRCARRQSREPVLNAYARTGVNGPLHHPGGKFFRV